MQSSRRSGPFATHRLARILAVCSVLHAIGCATPGVPRPPSLNLPEPPRDLSATRIGDAVELRFSVPSRSSDKLPLRGTNVTASFCRAVGTGPCQLVSSSTIVVPLNAANTGDGRGKSFRWTDTLPADLTHGAARSLRYSVELLNGSGRSAGMSTSAFTAAGQAPVPVEGLHAEGSRLGILVRWKAPDMFSGDIVLKREDLAHSLDFVQLTTEGRTASTSLLDVTAKPGVAYRYSTTRRVIVSVAGHSVELSSAPSESVDTTLQTTYAPLAPTGLTAAGFMDGAGTFAVDLIWQPVDDAGLITPLAGYNLYRAPAESAIKPTRLNPLPLAVPAFHDTTAAPNTRYRYRVTSVDVRGNESGGAGVVLEP